jgi:hypothetical protein
VLGEIDARNFGLVLYFADDALDVGSPVCSHVEYEEMVIVGVMREAVKYGCRIGRASSEEAVEV